MEKVNPEFKISLWITDENKLAFMMERLLGISNGSWRLRTFNDLGEGQVFAYILKVYSHTCHISSPFYVETSHEQVLFNQVRRRMF